jgi:hypothetical protein
MSVIKIVNLVCHGDARGSLVALESEGNVPFTIERVYFVYATKPCVSRGFHAHKDLKQLAICVAGKCRVILDNGRIREEVWLDSPTKGLLIDTLIWRELHDFSDDCVLLVLASKHFNSDDYVTNFDEFRQMVLGEKEFLSTKW